MNARGLCVGAGLGLLLLQPQPLRAAFQGLQVEVKPNTFGIVTFNVLAVFDNPGLDQLNAVAGTVFDPLSIFIKHGSYYQHPFGSDRAPIDLLVQSFPSLAFDSFVTIGVKSVGPPGGQPADDMILTPGWPGFGPTCSLSGDNLAWAIVPFLPQGNPFDPVHCYPGDGRVFIAQFSTADGDGLAGKFLIQMVSDGVPTLANVSLDYDLAPPPYAPCSVAGPGPHWMDCCFGGIETPFAEAALHIDFLSDGPFSVRSEVSLRLAGIAQVARSNASDDSAYFPGTAPVNGHLDVIDSEIVELELTAAGGGATVTIGAGQDPTRGATVELLADDSIGSSFFDLVMTIDLGDGQVLYNQQPVHVTAQVTCAPPQVTYFYSGPAIALYTSPGAGAGDHVADLTHPVRLRLGYPLSVPHVQGAVLGGAANAAD